MLFGKGAPDAQGKVFCVSEAGVCLYFGLSLAKMAQEKKG